MIVRDVMTADVVTAPVDASLAAAVERFLDAGVGSVVVVDGGTPTGLVTETDALAAALDSGRPLANIPLREVATAPPLTTTPDRTVQHLARRMADRDVKKVVVTEDVDVVGVVTLTDVVWHLSDIRSEAAAIADQDWGPRD